MILLSLWLCSCFLVMCCAFIVCVTFFFFSSRRRHTRCLSDWSSDVCSSDLARSRRQGVLRRLDEDPARPRVPRSAPPCCVSRRRRRDALGPARHGPGALARSQIGRASCREREKIAVSAE